MVRLRTSFVIVIVIWGYLKCLQKSRFGDVLRITHLRIAPQEGNSEVGNCEVHPRKNLFLRPTPVVQIFFGVRKDQLIFKTWCKKIWCQKRPIHFQELVKIFLGARKDHLFSRTEAKVGLFYLIIINISWQQLFPQQTNNKKQIYFLNLKV